MKGAKGEMKIKKVMQKFEQKFADAFEDYEAIFRACGVDIAETRALADSLANAVRIPTDSLRKAFVRFRKTYVYISEKELSADRCGKDAMKKYKKNVRIKCFYTGWPIHL